jgi:hypothetical protein
MLFLFFFIEYEPICSRFCYGAFKFFVHGRMSKCCLGVCPESRRIHNCMYDDGKLALIRTYMFYMAEMAPRRGFDQPYSCMHA